MADNLDMVEMAKRMAAMEGVIRGLVSTRQVKRSSIGTYDGEVQVSDVLEDAQDTSSVVPGALGDLVILDTAQSDDFDELSYIREETEEASENAFEASVRTTEVTLDVQAAQAAAEEASELALEAKITADGRNRIYAQALNPVASPEFPFVNGDLWYRTETVSGVTRFVEVFMWNGTEWKPYQMVASSLLVPGTVGPTLIENGAITTRKLAATAVDGMTVTGALIRTAASGERWELGASGLRGYGVGGALGVTLNPGFGGLNVISSDTDGRTWLHPNGVQFNKTSGATQGSITGRAWVLRNRAFGYAEADRKAIEADAVFGSLAITDNPNPSTTIGSRTVRMGLLGTGEVAFEVQDSHDTGGGSSTLHTPFRVEANRATHKGKVTTDEVFIRDLLSFGDSAQVVFPGDTDWASVAIASGASGYAHWCRYQGIIHLRFNITTNTAVASGAAYTQAFTLPAAALADLSTSGLESFAATAGSSGAATGIMNTSGTVTLRNLHTTAQSNFRGTAKWKPKP